MPTFQYLGGDHGRGLLEGALAEPQQTFEGRYLNRTIHQKAAVLFRSLVKNHPLIDGNKRTALSSLSVFLIMNNYLFYAPRNEAVEFTVGVASGDNEPGLKEIQRWIRNFSINIDHMLQMSSEDLAQTIDFLSQTRRLQVRLNVYLKETIEGLQTFL